MKLTIAFDDISLPLPPMERPDIRQLVIEQVLDMAADGRRGRRRAGRGPRAPPADDRSRAAPRPRRPDLRRLRPQRPPHPARRRGPRQLAPPGRDRPRRGRGDQPAGGGERPAGLRQHQPGGHGRRPQERGHRARQLQEPPPPPQSGDHAAVAIVHGPAPVRAPLVQLAHGPAHPGRGGEGVPDRDDAEQRHVPDGVPVPPEARVGVEGEGPASASWPPPRPSTGCRPGTPARSSTRCGPRTG